MACFADMKILYDNVDDYWARKQKRDADRAASPEAKYIEEWVKEKQREADRRREQSEATPV